MKKEMIKKLAELRCKTWEKNGRKVTKEDFTFFCRMHSRNDISTIKNYIAYYETI